jgi:RNA polymerase sigma factor (sigma-70 family)
MTNEEIAAKIQAGEDMNYHLYLLFKQNERFILRLIRNNNIDNKEDVKDAQQNAFLGLWEAVKRYDVNRGVKFLSFSAHYINNEIRNGYNRSNASKGISIPRHIYNLYFKIRTAERDLTAKLGRDATEHEIAEAVGISVARLEYIRTITKNQKSLYSPVAGSEKEDVFLIDMLADEENIQAQYEEIDLFRILYTELDELPFRQRKIIQKFYFGDESVPKIAHDIGLQNSALYADLNRALFKLRTSPRLKSAYYND